MSSLTDHSRCFYNCCAHYMCSLMTEFPPVTVAENAVHQSPCSPGVYIGMGLDMHSVHQVKLGNLLFVPGQELRQADRL